MDSVLKIFVSGSEQDQLAEQLSVIEKYSGFLLASIPQQNVSEIAASYPVEDITAQFYRYRNLDTIRFR